MITTDNRKELTAQQEAFSQAIASGMTQREAYKSVYNVSPDTKQCTIDGNASRIANNPKVKARIQSLIDERYASLVMSQSERRARLSQFAREEIIGKHGQPIRTSNIQAIALLEQMDGRSGTQININIEDLKIAILNAKQDDSKLIAENKPKLHLTGSTYSPENDGGNTIV